MGGLTTETAVLPPEEVERRIAEYRRISFQRQLPAQVVYQGDSLRCPWPGCSLRIIGIHFQLNKMGNEELVSRALASWWNGSGLIGLCPGCKRSVLFEVTGKQAVPDPALTAAYLLPDDWYLHAYIVRRSAFLMGVAT